MSIFCHRCGKKLESGDEFCQFCGAKISSSVNCQNISDRQILKRTDLEKKAWYRALKVIYIFFIVIVVLIIGAVSWSAMPTKTLDSDNSSIACSNGKSYAPSKNSIYIYSWEAELSLSNDKDARILCKYDNLNFYAHSGEVIAKNYTFIPVYEKMEYGSWIGYTIFAFFILWLILYLVKIGFLYIAVGEKPKIDIS